MRATPAINDWLADLVARDEVLKRTGLTILRERAAVGYHHEQFAVAPKGSPYLKMLAALWRESPVPLLRPGERLATMASLLHVDRSGASFAAELVRRSGLVPAEWLRRYLEAYLTPLLHCFYAYELVFMPHGENVIIVFDERGVPLRALFKDIAEEIAVMSADVPLPPAAERIRVPVPDELKTLSIFTDVFDCFFRFLGAILAEEGLVKEREFWAAVADCVAAYQDAAPSRTGRFSTYDLFAERFALSRLNRLQLRDNRQMVDLADPAGSLRFAGTLANPLHEARTAGSTCTLSAVRQPRRSAGPRAAEGLEPSPARSCHAGTVSEHRRWRVPAAPAVVKLAGAVLFAVVAATSGGERARLLLVGVAALALAAWGLRDVLAPVRLAADEAGVTVVTGYAGRRRIPWADVERVAVGEHRSLGLRTEILEIDTGETLHLFSRHELGAPCGDVERALTALRRSAGERQARAEGEEQQ